MHKHRTIFRLSLPFTVLILAGLTSCLRYEPMTTDAIDFYIMSSDYDEVGTRATVVDAPALVSSGFNVSCVNGTPGSDAQVWTNSAFSRSGQKYVGNRFWPAEDDSYRFYASNAALTYTAAGATVAATNATDVICAYNGSPLYHSSNQLNFKHIFARIGDVTISAAPKYTISDISITLTPKIGGTYNLRTGHGYSDGVHGWSSVTTGSATAIANSTPGTRSNDLYLIPGVYTISASWHAVIGSEYDETFTGKNYDVTIAGGMVNTITATLGGNAVDVVFDVEVAPWNDNEILIGRYPVVSETIIDGLMVGSVGAAVASASSSVTFEDLAGEPIAYYLTVDMGSGGSLGSNTGGVISMVGDATRSSCVYSSGTSNETTSSYTVSYSDGSFTVNAPSGTTFAAKTYTLTYIYGEGEVTWRTATVQPASGQTSAQYTGLAGRPALFACQLNTQVSSATYHRVASVVGQYDSGSYNYVAENFYSNNFYNITDVTISNPSTNALTLATSGTNNGGYFHNPGTYTLFYVTDADLEDGGSGGGSGGGGSEPEEESTFTTEEKTRTLTTASQSISFTGLSGEPKAFFLRLDIASGDGLGSSAAGVISVVGDSDTHTGVYTTGTQHNYSTAFSYSYSGGTLTVTAPSGVTFAAQTYSLVSAYGDGSIGWRETTYEPGTGITQTTFSGLEDQPELFACQLESEVTSATYHRVASVTGEYDKDAYAYDYLAYNFYSNNTYAFTMTSVGYSGGLQMNTGGQNAGGYFHNPGLYRLYYLTSGDLTDGNDVSGGGSTANNQGADGTFYYVSGNCTGTGTQTLSISFGQEPKAFMVLLATSDNLGTEEAGVLSVVCDSDSSTGNYTTGTQVNYSSGFTWSYSTPTLTITAPSGIVFPIRNYVVTSIYGSGTIGWRESTFQPGSGVTSTTFSSLTGTPALFALQLESQVNSETYHRVAAVQGDNQSGTTGFYGLTFYDSDVYLYDNGSSFSVTWSGSGLTFNSGGANEGGYFHNPGTYKLYYLNTSDVSPAF